MAKSKIHAPEQIVSLLPQIEMAVAKGKATPALAGKWDHRTDLNDLVAGTANFVPATVGKETEAARAMLDKDSLVMATVRMPTLALRSAAKVSDVSPDWEIPIIAARLLSESGRYAYSTSTWIPLKRSTRTSAGRPASPLEPLAAIMISAT